MTAIATRSQETSAFEQRIGEISDRFQLEFIEIMAEAEKEVDKDKLLAFVSCARMKEESDLPGLVVVAAAVLRRTDQDEDELNTLIHSIKSLVSRAYERDK